MQELINRAKELLADGTVVRVLGWKKGDLPYNPEPHIFTSAQELEKDFIYNGFKGIRKLVGILGFKVFIHIILAFCACRECSPINCSFLNSVVFDYCWIRPPVWAVFNRYINRTIG